MKPIFSRGPSLQIRFILAVLVALGIIIADNRTRRSVKSVLIWIPPSVLSTLFPMLLVNCWMAYRRRWPRVTNWRKPGVTSGTVAENSELLMLGQYKQENARLRELLEFAASG